MGDIGDSWREERERDRAEKAERARVNREVLAQSEFDYIDHGGHIRFAVPGRPKVDFYPTTSKWQVCATHEIHLGDAHDFIRWYRHQHDLAPRFGGNRAPY